MPKLPRTSTRSLKKIAHTQSALTQWHARYSLADKSSLINRYKLNRVTMLNVSEFTTGGQPNYLSAHFVENHHFMVRHLFVF